MKAMTFLKSLWRKLFPVKKETWVWQSGWIDFDDKNPDLSFKTLSINGKVHPIIYDPSEDPEKILKGEFESYFD